MLVTLRCKRAKVFTKCVSLFPSGTMPVMSPFRDGQRGVAC